LTYSTNRSLHLSFHFSALDTVILLSVAVLLKDRLDQARFRLSDMKHGPRSI
jgi:hypothetical protein